MIGLQEMLMQTVDNKIYLFPAWPKEWDVSFKLHTPFNTTVEGVLKNRQIVSSNRLELNSAGKRSDRDITVIVSLVTSSESENPTKSAIQLLDEFEKQSVSKEKEVHQLWWKNFWEQSFVHLEDGYIENIYYLRRYLMASSSRGKFPVVFNGGIWTWNHDVRNWVTPHHWNTQQQYWGLCAQNDC